MSEAQLSAKNNGTDMSRQSAPEPAPFLRRLAAMLYDSLIVIALLMLTTLLLLPLNKGEAYQPGVWWFQASLLIVALAFYLFFWRHGGQTLGMRAWKIKLVASDANGTVSWQQMIIRIVTAALGLLCFGLGFLWAIIDKNKLAAHDHLSRTKLIRVGR